ncbi:hypothetical protein ACU1JV_21835 [Paenibacillus sp. T2-29]
MATTNNYGVRQALNSKGVNNSRIGYSNGYVTVDGKNFLKAGSVNNGSAMTTQQGFNNAWSSLKPTSAPVKVPNQPKSSPSPMVQAATSVQSSPQATYTPIQRQTEQTLQRMNDMINNQPAFQYKAPDPWSYNPQDDPSYTSSLAEAKRNIETEQADTNARLRANGQGKSSYSELVSNQVADNTMSSLANTLVPQLMQQSYSRYSDAANRDMQLQQLNYGVQRDKMGDLTNLYGLQNQEYFQNPITEGQLTGNYLPAEGRQAIDQLLSLKQQAETKGVTAEQRASLTKQADGIRAQLSALGIDPSKYGANVNYNSARTASPGIRTLQGQQMDLQNRQANQQAANTVSELSGKLVTPQSDWQGLYRQASNPNAPQTFQSQQFAYQKARDAITDQQWRLKFDQDVQQFGMSYALQSLQEQNNTAYRQATLAIQSDDNARQWADLDYKQANQGSAAGGLTANQVLQSMQGLYSVPVYGKNADGDSVKEGTKITTDASKRQEMFQNVVDAGLSDAETRQILSSLGMQKAEIDKYKKLYSGN